MANRRADTYFPTTIRTGHDTVDADVPSGESFSRRLGDDVGATYWELLNASGAQVAKIDSLGISSFIGSTFKGDDVFYTGGNTSAAPNFSLGWETADANANVLLLSLPAGTATDVPGFVVGDDTALNKDLGLFDGETDPFVAVLSSDATKAIYFNHDGTDGNLRVTSGSLNFNVPAGSAFEFSVNDISELTLNATNLKPSSNGGLVLGFGGTGEFAGLFLQKNTAVNWDNGDTMLTHTDGIGLVLAGPMITSAGNSDSLLLLTQELNDSTSAAGTQTYRGIDVNVTTTDITGWDGVNLLDLRVGASSNFKVVYDGSVDVTLKDATAQFSIDSSVSAEDAMLSIAPTTTIVNTAGKALDVSATFDDTAGFSIFNTATFGATSAGFATTGSAANGVSSSIINNAGDAANSTMASYVADVTDNGGGGITMALQVLADFDYSLASIDDDINIAAMSSTGANSYNINLTATSPISAGAGGNINLSTGNGTGVLNGGDIVYTLGAAGGAPGRQGVFEMSGANDDVRWKMRGTGVFRIEDSGSTEALTLDHNGVNAVYSTTLGQHSFGQSIVAEVSGVSRFQNTADSADLQSLIIKGGNRGTPTDNDTARLSLYSDDSTGTQVEFANMKWIATDVTNTSKDSAIVFETMKANALTEVLRLEANATKPVIITGGATISGSLNVDQNITGLQIKVDGDSGGTAGLTTFTNATAIADTNVPTFINTPTGVAAAQATWVKIYIGTTATYIPVWQ